MGPVGSGQSDWLLVADEADSIVIYICRCLHPGKRHPVVNANSISGDICGETSVWSPRVQSHSRYCMAILCCAVVGSRQEKVDVVVVASLRGAIKMLLPRDGDVT